MTVRVDWYDAPVLGAERAAAERGLDLALQHVLGAARAGVPLEEGTLERSGTTDREGLVGCVSFDTVYARRQHEELTWRHDPGRRAKYLELAAVEEADTARELIGQAVRAALS